MDLWHTLAAFAAAVTSAASMIAAYVSLSSRAALAELEIRIIDRLTRHVNCEIDKCSKQHGAELDTLALAISTTGANGRARLNTGARPDA